MTTYIALMRGINVGNRPPTRMEDLRKLFEQHGYTRVSTILASGNVVFEADKSDPAQLRQDVERMIAEGLGFSAAVLLWSADALRHLAQQAPYESKHLVKPCKANVTFVGEASVELDDLSAPPAGVEILGQAQGAVFSVVNLEQGGTLDLMGYLEEHIGKEVTTRTWKTIEKILAKL